MDYNFPSRGAVSSSTNEWNSILWDARAQYLSICIVYVVIFSYHTRHSITAYYTHSNSEKFITLVLHILAATFELTRYYIAASNGTVLPDILDTTACLVHSLTSLRLARALRRGDNTTRASYQAPAILRPFLALFAVTHNSAFAHQACVKLLHAFLYTRLIIFVAKRVGLGNVQTHAKIYAQAVTLGAVLAIISSGIPGGVPTYLVAVAVVMVLNQRVSMNLASPVHAMTGLGSIPATRVCIPTFVTQIQSAVRLATMVVMEWLGLFEIADIETNHRPPTVPVVIVDEYVEKAPVIIRTLPVDDGPDQS
ncbi:unnamed protein product [Fusarium langsethiae]|nr:unnamed protein product [Fusarium langsethiae]